MYVIHNEHNEYLIAFGKRVEELRTKQGLTKVQLAFEMSTGEKYIRRLEKGEINITLANILKLSNALNVPIQELFPMQ